MGLAFVVVMVSKQGVKVTSGLSTTVIDISLLVDGLPVVQSSEEMRVQVTTSPLSGIYENAALFIPALFPLTFH